MTKAAEHAAKVQANKREAYIKRVRNLTGHIFTRLNFAALDIAFATGVPADTWAAQLAALEPVGLAIHPLKVTAIEYAAGEARKAVEVVRKELAEHGGDINSAAPWIRDDRFNSRYYRFHSLVQADPNHSRTYTSGKPYFVVMSDERIARFVEQREQIAAAQYDMFICKMVAKVGECQAAKIDGNPRLATFNLDRHQGGSG